MATVASYLLEYRQRQNLSLRALAAKVGFSFTHLHDLETGNRNLTPDTLRLLGAHLSTEAVEELKTLAAGEERARLKLAGQGITRKWAVVGKEEA